VVPSGIDDEDDDDDDVFDVSRLVAGFYSARLYKTLRGVQWKQSALLVGSRG